MSDVLIAAKNGLDDSPVDGVLIRVYTLEGVLVTQGTTGEGANADGERLFDLLVGSYTIRLSLSVSGYSIVSPQALEVTGVPADDIFEIDVELFEYPAAIDARLCRCSGHFLSPDGRPVSGATLRFTHLDRPALLGLDAVLPKKVETKTDLLGYTQVDLIREAIYRVEIEGYEDLGIETKIPERASANLPDVLFPIVTEVVFDPASLILAVDESVEVEVTVRYRSGLEVPLADFEGKLPIAFETSVAEIIRLAYTSDWKLQVTALAAGATVLSAVRVSTSAEDPITAFPDPDPVEGTLEVTVA